MNSYLHSDGPPRFLDVGCSTGFVVEAAQLAGWDAQGIDLNPSAVEFGRRRGLELSNIALQDLDVPPGTFDSIGLFDVLEHLVDPKALLERAIYLLKPKGIIFLYVPNYDSASRLLMGKEAHFIWPTHHLTYFTPVTVTKFIESMGLKVEMMVTEGLDIFDYIWAQECIHEKDMQMLSVIADRLQFFINGSLWGKNLRVLVRLT
jgi:2-polyprenyl-3-methyl-5-hydroxy-6-metoxy-1,4-benzoquinol methylase